MTAHAPRDQDDDDRRIDPALADMAEDFARRIQTGETIDPTVVPSPIDDLLPTIRRLVDLGARWGRQPRIPDLPVSRRRLNPPLPPESLEG